VGRWVWLNFWAAWCVPCREEIPRLKDWERRLRAQGAPFDLVFVSLDDDQRQLMAFLQAEAGSGLRQSFWLREGREREEWLEALGMSPEPELPAHAVLQNGRVRCIVSGAVEDADFDQVAQIVGVR
jgi:thiol-disulfide isomerase/thioredoxin